MNAMLSVLVLSSGLTVGCAEMAAISNAPPPPQNQGFVPTHGPAADPAPSSSISPTPAAPQIDQRQHAREILERGAAIEDLVEKALTLDGSDDASRIARAVIPSCHAGRPKCEELTGQAAQTSKVGALAGWANWLIGDLGGYLYAYKQGSNVVDNPQILDAEARLPEAEKFARTAVEQAQKVVDARAAQQATIDAEKTDVNAARLACDSAPATCEPKCKAGDNAYCVAHAMRLWKATTPKLEAAKALMGKTCDAGSQTACAFVPQIDADIAAFAQQTGDLWSEVQRVGDDLATKKFLGNEAITYSNTERNRRAYARMQQFNAAVVREQYCPAKKALIAHAGAAEFSKRARAHCKDDPPSHSGISGADVVLNQQCSEVYATARP